MCLQNGMLALKGAQVPFSPVDSSSSPTKDSFYYLHPHAFHIWEQLSSKQTALRTYRFVFLFKKKIKDESW